MHCIASRQGLLQPHEASNAVPLPHNTKDLCVSELHFNALSCSLSNRRSMSLKFVQTIKEVSGDFLPSSILLQTWCVVADSAPDSLAWGIWVWYLIRAWLFEALMRYWVVQCESFDQCYWVGSELLFQQQALFGSLFSVSTLKFGPVFQKAILMTNHLLFYITYIHLQYSNPCSKRPSSCA